MSVPNSPLQLVFFVAMYTTGLHNLAVALPAGGAALLITLFSQLQFRVLINLRAYIASGSSAVAAAQGKRVNTRGRSKKSNGADVGADSLVLVRLQPRLIQGTQFLGQLDALVRSREAVALWRPAFRCSAAVAALVAARTHLKRPLPPPACL